MTQAPTDKLMIEQVRLSDFGAAELERSAGYLVMRLAPVRGEEVWVASESQANELATWTCKKYPGSMYGVYKLTRAYHVEPTPHPGAGAESEDAG